VESFSPTLLFEVKYDQYKYGGCLHLSKLYVWGENERSTHAHSLRRGGAWHGMAKGAGARRSREWFAEIRPLALWGALLPFIFGYLAFKLTRYGSLIGFLIVQNRSQLGSWALLYIRPIDLHQNTF